MTADELARVTAERDAAVAALARVEALRSRWDERGKRGNEQAARCEQMLRHALHGADYFGTTTASDEEVLAIAAENAERWAGALDLLAQAEAAERNDNGPTGEAMK